MSDNERIARLQVLIERVQMLRRLVADAERELRTEVADISATPRERAAA